jgi:hypothetical protein
MNEVAAASIGKPLLVAALARLNGNTVRVAPNNFNPKGIPTYYSTGTRYRNQRVANHSFFVFFLFDLKCIPVQTIEQCIHLGTLYKSIDYTLAEPLLLALLHNGSFW